MMKQHVKHKMTQKLYATVMRYGALLLISAFFSLSAQAQLSLSEHTKLQTIADSLIAEHGYSQVELDSIFAAGDFQQSVLDSMQNPAEYKFTWGKYRKLFLQEDRIEKGVDFWLEYEDELSAAEQQYGVPASVIVAIIGVESKFGKYRGKHKVLDSLATLVVGFERRSQFFGNELKEFLILCKENELNPNDILGSYAGAVGYPQFISSSYRAYAVDFSGDGRIDLINQPIDAIGSVANYFVKNGWLTGQPVSSEPHTQLNSQLSELANRKRKMQYTAKQLRALGAPLSNSVDDAEKLNVLMLDSSEVLPESKAKSQYIVRAGDTACRIAKRHNVSCSALIALNKLNSKGVIYRDQLLKLPAKAVVKSAADKWQVGESDNKADKEVESTDNSSLRYFFTHENFYVITRYNQSVLYAMAVNDLSEAINQAYHSRTKPVASDVD